MAKKTPRKARTAKLQRTSPSLQSVKKRKLIAGKSIAEIGRTFDVQYALEGSARRAGNHVRIDVKLIQVSDQTNLWANSYTGDLGDILNVQDEVTAAVAGQIRIALPVGAL